ncbi:MAG: EamA family transporter [Clostridiales bacterium]|nr:EamA family transporter [Clostridiales bacterium]
MEKDEMKGNAVTAENLNKKRIKVKNYHIFALITVTLWASSFAFTKISLEVFTVPVLSMYRFIFAGLFMLIFGIVKKIGLPDKKDIPVFILSAAIGFSVYQLVFNKGIDMLTSATACIVIAITPVITAIFARVLFKEKIRAGGWVAIGICFFGILVLMLWDGVLSINAGIFWMLIAAIFLAGYNLLQRKLTKRYTALQATAYSIIIGAVMLLVFMPFGGVEQAADAGIRHWLATAYLGILPSAIAYLLWSKALAMAEKTSEVSNFMFIQPAIAMLLGFLIVFEIPTMGMYVGAAIIIFGLFLFSAKK